MAGLAAGQNSSPHKPHVATPPAWSVSNKDIVADATGDLSQWWEKLGDATLSKLVTEALASNTDLRTARSRLRQARANRNLTDANRYPSLNGTASISRNKTFHPDVDSSGSFSPGFDASWEPDLSGAKRSALQGSEADVRATTADLHNTQVSLASEVALNYVQLRSYQTRLQISRKNEASQAETLQLTQWREQAGLVTAIDVEQARTSLEQTRASIPSLESSIEQSQASLAVLLGLTPGELKQRLTETAPVPAPPDQVAVGIPADTLRQRPDVRAAEERITAETARLSKAKAAKYPSFSLRGSLGLNLIGGAFGAGLGATNALSSFTGSLTQSIFDRGRIRQQIEIQDTTQEQAVLNYESTVLTALQEVENAMVSFSRNRERLAALNNAAEAARNAATLARDRYTAGLIDFQTVLDTQRTVLNLEDSVASTQAERTTAVIQLYKALGGGWSPAKL
jgi:NodT family efflux transporter outer membrane factor (OMF) lipoprotein